MAKKVEKKDFNLSRYIRALLEANPKLTSKDIRELLTDQNPNYPINQNSFSVCFYTIRKKLGIGSKRSKSTGSQSRTALSGGYAGSKRSGTAISIEILKATARFMTEVGGADSAVEAIKQVASLQIA